MKHGVVRLDLSLWRLTVWRVLLYGAWSVSCSVELGVCLALCVCEECEAQSVSTRRAQLGESVV